MILDELVASTRVLVTQRKQETPIEAMRARALATAPPLDAVSVLGADGGVSIIAEVKRASPSKGALNMALDPAALAATYASAGASAISVLTEPTRFHGRLADLAAVREAVGERCAVLRKDFIVDPYQLYEARAYGASMALLIVAALDDGDLAALYQQALDLGLTPLVEVHNEAELRRALPLQPRLLGINNRDLHTFDVNIETTRCLLPLVPNDAVLVSESGIHSPEQMRALAEMGVDAALIGEALVTASDPAKRLIELLEAGKRAPNASPRRGLVVKHDAVVKHNMVVKHDIVVKICGLTTLDDASHACLSGADLLGFIFVESSPRCVSPDAVAKITRALRDEGCSAGLVGLFHGHSVNEIRDIVARCDLDMVQLHGDVSREAVRTLDVPVLAAHRVRERVPWDELRGIGAHAYVLDSYVKGQLGGTGRTWRWEIVDEGRPANARVMMAGGLNPDNVGDVIRATRPWGVDVASGVELRPGIKDPQRVTQFVLRARAAARGLRKPSADVPAAPPIDSNQECMT